MTSTWRSLQWLFAIVILFYGWIPGASGRQVVVIAERPYFDPKLPPSQEQYQRALVAEQTLVERALQLQIEDHILVEGGTADDAELFELAEGIVQITLSVSSLGYLLDAEIYDRSRDKWYQLAKHPFGPIGAELLGDSISNLVLPRMVVDLFELSESKERPILLVDCLLPMRSAQNAASPNDLERKAAEEIRQAAEFFSLGYASKLRDDAHLQAHFSVVPLIATPLPQFYEWWCMKLDVPRKGALRQDTATVFGVVRQLPGMDRPRVSLAITRRAHDHPTVKQIVVDLLDSDVSLQQMMNMVEELVDDK